jgi:hypothetical protein
MSHNPMGLHGLLQRYLSTFYLSKCINACIKSFFLSCNCNILKFMPESYPYFPYKYHTWASILMCYPHMAFQNKIT